MATQLRNHHSINKERLRRLCLCHRRRHPDRSRRAVSSTLCISTPILQARIRHMLGAMCHLRLDTCHILVMEMGQAKYTDMVASRPCSTLPRKHSISSIMLPKNNIMYFVMLIQFFSKCGTCECCFWSSTSHPASLLNRTTPAVK